MSNDRRPLIAALITMVLWASAFVVIRALGGHFSPGALALGRLAVGSLVLTVIFLRRPRRLPRGRVLILLVSYGALWFGVYTIAVNAAGRELDAGTSAMLVNLGPIIIAVLAGLFLGEGFPRGLVIGLAVAFVGVLTIAAATTTGKISGLGVALALAAAGLYAVGVLLQKQVLRTVDPVTTTWLGCVAGFAVCVPFIARLVSEAATASPMQLAGVVYLGAVPTAAAFVLWSYALSRTSAGTLSASSYLVPAVAVLLSWWFLSEVPQPLALVGGAIALLGVAITRLLKPRPDDARLSRSAPVPSRPSSRRPPA